VLYGRSSHHKIEAVFKAFARALRVACAKDKRLARMLPPSGRYFPVDKLSDHYTRPLDPLALSKFAYIPGMSRVYDSGDIKIYDLWGAGYAR